ncbi:NUMOD4 motif protein [Microbacterium ginsengisoli]|uniref:NUMOD4 motif protein n=1 Tax=Microbacterium ginsengisoli TaxID=400772 RepID=A0A0F0LWG5_9MICO|nr:NUMOD4 motif-containing HNH endonuclease [Microbacterium ginsengisoli]KJL37044.1 NUMOD4 motif protein [Microbacterium ginsengisoli]
MNERWMDHPQYPLIEVSDLGRVRSAAFIGDGIVGRRGWHYRPRLRKLTVNDDGYLTVQVGASPAGRMVKVHTLVLETFVGPRPAGMEVLHLDANRANPALRNLRYGTRSENQRQRVADGNHHLANKTHCSRGHRLVAPNLRAQGIKHGKRQCRACHLGTQWARRHPGVSLQESCDKYYPPAESRTGGLA